MTDAEVIAAIRAHHLKANIDECEREPEKWGRPIWDEAWLDGDKGWGPYLHVPIRGGEWDGTAQRVYPPARLRRRLARLWEPSTANDFTRVDGSAHLVRQRATAATD